MDWRVYKQGLDLLRKLPSPVYFEYIRSSCESCELPEGEQIGFLAQQLEVQAPEMVIPAGHWGRPDLKAVDYTVLLLVCYNAIRELDRRVKTLEARLGSTEAAPGESDTEAGPKAP